MNEIKPFSEFDNLNEYLKHEQYKFVFTHPLFLRYGNKKGISFIREKGLNKTLRYHYVLLFVIGFFSSMWTQYLTPWVIYPLITLSSFTIFHGITHFVFYRNKLIKQLERNFLYQTVRNEHVKNMLPILSIDQKEAILDIVLTKENIIFKDLINALQKTNDKKNKEKIISLLEK